RRRQGARSPANRRWSFIRAASPARAIVRSISCSRSVLSSCTPFAHAMSPVSKPPFSSRIRFNGTNVLKLSTRTLVFLMHPAASKSQSPRRLRLPPHADLPPHRPNDRPASGARSGLVRPAALWPKESICATRYASHRDRHCALPSQQCQRRMWTAFPLRGISVFVFAGVHHGLPRDRGYGYLAPRTICRCAAGQTGWEGRDKVTKEGREGAEKEEEEGQTERAPKTPWGERVGCAGARV
ncbi:hypothetical protein C8J57DRAFT_1600594, partial [Mycena rebaudengoi]